MPCHKKTCLFAYGKTKTQINHAACRDKLISAFGFTTDSTIPLLSKSELSSLQLSFVAVQPSFCWTWSETKRLICAKQEPNQGEYLVIIKGHFSFCQFSIKQGLSTHLKHLTVPLLKSTFTLLRSTFMVNLAKLN